MSSSPCNGTQSSEPSLSRDTDRGTLDDSAQSAESTLSRDTDIPQQRAVPVDPQIWIILHEDPDPEPTPRYYTDEDLEDDFDLVFDAVIDANVDPDVDLPDIVDIDVEMGLAVNVLPAVDFVFLLNETFIAWLPAIFFVLFLILGYCVGWHSERELSEDFWMSEFEHLRGIPAMY